MDRFFMIVFIPLKRFLAFMIRDSNLIISQAHEINVLKWKYFHDHCYSSFFFFFYQPISIAERRSNDFSFVIYTLYLAFWVLISIYLIKHQKSLKVVFLTLKTIGEYFFGL